MVAKGPTSEKSAVLPWKTISAITAEAGYRSPLHAQTRKETTEMTSEEANSTAEEAPSESEEPPEAEAGFSDTNSPRGAASYSRQDVGRIVHRSVSQRYANKLNADSRDAAEENLVMKIREFVFQFGLEQRGRESFQQEAEGWARRVKKDGEATETEIALYAVLKTARARGWSFERAVERLAVVDRRVAAVEDLRIAVLLEKPAPPGPGGNSGGGDRADDAKVSVRVGGEQRGVEEFQSDAKVTRLLRIPVYTTDDGKVLELRGASLWITKVKGRSVCEGGEKRLEVRDAHTAVVRVGRSFALLKLLKKIELGEGYTPPPVDQAPAVGLLLRRFWTGRLPLTEDFLREAGMLALFRSKYSGLFRREFDAAGIKEELEKASWDEGKKCWVVVDMDGRAREGPLLAIPAHPRQGGAPRGGRRGVVGDPAAREGDRGQAGGRARAERRRQEVHGEEGVRGQERVKSLE